MSVSQKAYPISMGPLSSHHNRKWGEHQGGPIHAHLGEPAVIEETLLSRPVQVPALSEFSLCMCWL